MVLAFIFFKIAFTSKYYLLLSLDKGLVFCVGLDNTTAAMKNHFLPHHFIMTFDVAILAVKGSRIFQREVQKLTKILVGGMVFNLLSFSFVHKLG